MFRKSQPSPTIRFLCQKEDLGVIAAPRPAKTALPDWFRKIPAVDQDRAGASDSGLTIKRCMPFLDAMTAGWVLPLAATVRMEIKDEGRVVETGWDFDKTLVSNHAPHQVTGHPKTPRPPCKFHNYWQIRTAPGWSCLFVPPLNRPNGVFEAVAGVVDTDAYHAHIHFPFFPIGPDGLHVIEKGTPLVQVIPFRRADVEIDSEIRAETEEEVRDRERVFRSTVAAPGWYRTVARAVRG